MRKTSAGRTIHLAGQAIGRSGHGGPRRSRRNFQRQLDQIDLELSAMIVEDPNFWELGALQAGRDAVQPIGNSSGAGRARMLVSKIARFEDIKRRKQALAACGRNWPGPTAANEPFATG